MNRLLALAILTFSSGPQSASQPSALPAALQGSWTIESVNGQKLSTLGQKSSRTFKGTTYTVTTNGQVKESGTVRVDTRKKPAEIDMTINQGVAVGSTQIGIVEVVNGELTLQTNSFGTPKRPTEFNSEPWYTLIVAKKDR